MWSKSASVSFMISFMVVAALAYATDRHHLEFMKVDLVHGQKNTGQGVVVALIDTGVNLADPRLKGRLVKGFSVHKKHYVPDGGQQQPPNKHGNQMALAITDGELGVAPGAKVLPVRIESGGQVHGEDFAWTINLLRLKKSAVMPELRVINISVGVAIWKGCSCNDHGIDTSIAQASEKGILVVAATGDEAKCDGVGFPSCANHALPVIALYDKAVNRVVEFPKGDGTLWCNDPFPPAGRVVCISDVHEGCNFAAAPGFEVPCADGELLSGASVAGAEVAGVAALVFSKAGPCSPLTGTQARDAILSHGESVSMGPEVWCPNAGQATAVNALAAVNATSAVSS